MMARKKKIHHRHNRLSFGGKLAFVLLTILSAVILIPIVFTFLYSFFPQSEITAYLKGRGSYDTTKWLDVLYSPAMFSLRQYYKIFIEEPSYLKLFCNSMMYTGAILVGQALIVPLTAYCLSRFQFHGRDLLFFCILVLMILPFQVTMAPSVTVLRWLGIMETPWAVILPMCFSPFYIFLLRQFMVGIPNELLEASKLDGCNDFQYFFHIVLPLSTTVISVITLYYAVAHWNSYFNAFLYLSDRKLYPLQIFLRQILVQNKFDTSEVTDPELAQQLQGLNEVLKYSIIVVSSAPLMCLYPFVQKHFVKGVMIGSVKG